MKPIINRNCKMKGTSFSLPFAFGPYFAPMKFNKTLGQREAQS